MRHDDFYLIEETVRAFVRRYVLPSKTGLFNLFLEHDELQSPRSGQGFVVERKQVDSVVEEWPLALKLAQHEEGFLGELYNVPMSGYTSLERYIEWKRIH